MCGSWWISSTFTLIIRIFNFYEKHWQQASMYCEKSITLNSEELEEAVQLAKEHHVVAGRGHDYLPYAYL